MVRATQVHHTGRQRLARRFAVGLALVGALALAACNSTSTHWNGAGAGGQNDATKLHATISAPADGAIDVPASIEITYKAANAKSTAVELTNASSGTKVDGSPRSDGSSWVPAQALLYGTKYTAKVTATGPDGKTAASTVTFTTMAKPANTVAMHSWIGDNQVYGVGAPIVLTFGKAIPEDQRAAVQRRLFVQTTPAQEGIWNWLSPTEVHYRPKDYWQTGTKIALRALFGGVPLGNGAYGGSDLTVDASVATSAVRLEVDDKSKTLTVTQDGKVIKTIPASLGKATTPTSTGNMVIMTRAAQEIFDSATTGIMPGQPGYYKETVFYTLRLTWGGQYIHAAPWSTGAQGSYDVSHGCTNISMNDAQWLYGVVHVGDPVVVKNTGSPLKWGDGWTDWNESWDEYVKGSAIPYVPAAVPSASPS
jgi:lipoprotein-anchoring transpeptidase ErfK/SrfK